MSYLYIYIMLNLFNKKKDYFLNNKVLSSSLDSNRELGQTRHYPPANQEWFNSIYTYNQNIIKSLPIADKIVNKLIKSYYDLSIFTNSKIRSARKRFRLKRLSTNRIFVSKAELKHTNNKVIITVYTYNREKKYLVRKITKMYLKNFKRLKTFFLQGLRVINKVKKEKKIFLKTLKWNNNNFNRYEKLYYNNYIKKSLKKERLYLYYNSLLTFNNFKFKDFFLLRLKNLISKIYNKKIELNIVNLKKLHLNSDIFSKSIVIKLKNRNNRYLKVLTRALNTVKLPLLNKYYYPYSELNKMFLEKYKNINNLNSNFTQDALHELLYKMFSYKNQSYSLSSNKEAIVKNVFNSIKNKKINGVRLEATGRLTRRLTAQRSIFKFKNKGSLKNRDSSNNGISSVILKGHIKPNLQYTKLNSKTRNGSFGLKSWVSSF